MNRTLLLLSCLILCSCATPQKSLDGVPTEIVPLVLDVRDVRPITKLDKKLILVQTLGYLNGYDAKHGVWLLFGEYTVEAEDTAYFYLRSESGLEVCFFREGESKAYQTTRLSGGAVVSKEKPAVRFAYIDLNGGRVAIVQEYLSGLRDYPFDWRAYKAD